MTIPALSLAPSLGSADEPSSVIRSCRIVNIDLPHPRNRVDGAFVAVKEGIHPNCGADRR